ncbi:MAG: hypothetical protein IJI05_02265 [Erysipelotrichaceae bacterium]|nr:hypothetical protein [Erysipelotrichaceae bacterium]
MKGKAGIILAVLVISLFGFRTDALTAQQEKPEIPEKQEYHVHGEQTVISVSNNWISNDPEQRTWVIEVPGVPEEVYIIDREAQEEISHYETRHHRARTHTEYEYGTRVKTIFTYIDLDDGEMKIAAFYDPVSSDYLGLGNILDVRTETERYVISSYTVVDREAYDERVKVIDQPALEELGHYETIIVGEVGHHENLIEMENGIGEGHFEAVVRRFTVSYQQEE